MRRRRAHFVVRLKLRAARGAPREDGGGGRRGSKRPELCVVIGRRRGGGGVRNGRCRAACRGPERVGRAVARRQAAPARSCRWRSIASFSRSTKIAIKDWGSWVISSRTALGGGGWKGGWKGRRVCWQKSAQANGWGQMREDGDAVISSMCCLGPMALGLYREIPPGIRGFQRRGPLWGISWTVNCQAGPARSDLEHVLAPRADLLSPEVHKQRHLNPHRRPESEDIRIFQ